MKLQSIAKATMVTNLMSIGNNPEPYEISACKERKIVIAGSVGSGKSTAIHAVSEVPVIAYNTQTAMGTNPPGVCQDLTFMNYGVAQIADLQVNLYTAPGQKRFDFLETVLCRGAGGILILIDSNGFDPLGDIDHYLKLHKQFLETGPVVIAITHFDKKPATNSLLAYQAQVYKNGHSCPVILLDTRNKQEVSIALRTLISLGDDFHIGINQLN